MTTTTIEKPLISNAQIEVWEWKNAAWKDVEHLDLRDALLKRLENSAETCRILGFVPAVSEK